MTYFNDSNRARIKAEFDRAAKRPRALLTPGEVAKLFRVDPKTVTRWAHAGRIGHTRTPGGHVRFYEDEVMALLNPEGL